MRLGFLLAMLGLGALVVIALIFIPPKSGNTNATEAAPAIPAEAAPGVQPLVQGEAKLTGEAKSNETQSSTTAPLKPDTNHGREQDPDVQQAKHEVQVAARIAELGNLSSKKDIASVETLLSEVRNTDPAIRQAALDAISQSGNRGTIPGLQEAAAQTEDAEQKTAIEEVIEFLKLPTLTEVMRARSTTNISAPPNRP